METDPFKIYEPQPNSKIVVKHDDLVSSEIDCVNIYQSKVKEVDKNELLLSSVIGHGTGFNVEKLFIIRIDPVKNFIKRISSNKRRDLKIYSVSNKEVFKQLRQRTKFEVTKNWLKIIVDGKEIYEA